MTQRTLSQSHFTNLSSPSTATNSDLNNEPNNITSSLTSNMEKMLEDLKQVDASIGKIHKGNALLLAMTNLQSLLGTMIDGIGSLQTKVVDLTVKVESLESGKRALEDKVDHHHQRSLRGKFILSPIKDHPFQTDVQLLNQNISIVEYVCGLMDSKYGVKPDVREIKTCHSTNSGNIIFRFGNMAPGSSFHRLCYAIKNGQGKDCKVFFFFSILLQPPKDPLYYSNSGN